MRDLNAARGLRSRALRVEFIGINTGDEVVNMSTDARLRPGSNSPEEAVNLTAVSLTEQRRALSDRHRFPHGSFCSDNLLPQARQSKTQVK